MKEPLPTRVPLPACPICGAEPAKRRWCEPFGSSYGAGLLRLIVGQKRTWLGGSSPKIETAKPVVCTHCGYIQMFIDPTSLENQ